MMNNLQKDLQENVEKYNGKHHLHKRVKVINCYYCYPISTEANIQIILLDFGIEYLFFTQQNHAQVSHYFTLKE